MFRVLVAVVIISGLGLVASIVLWLSLRAQERSQAATGGAPPEVREYTDGAEVTPEPPVISGETAFSFDPANPLAPSPIVADYGLEIPEFSLIDQNGNPVDQSIFEQRPTVLSFVFTHCVLICPTMTAQMHTVYDAVDGTDINFVSISVDPQRDTPARLRQYAAQFGIDHDRWTFLTGEFETIHAMVYESLRFDLSEDPSEANRIALPDGTSMANINHPSRLVLVAPNRSVIGLYKPTLEEDVAELIARLRAIDAAR